MTKCVYHDRRLPVSELRTAMAEPTLPTPTRVGLCPHAPYNPVRRRHDAGQA